MEGSDNHPLSARRLIEMLPSGWAGWGDLAESRTAPPGPLTATTSRPEHPSREESTAGTRAETVVEWNHTMASILKTFGFFNVVVLRSVACEISS